MTSATHSTIRVTIPVGVPDRTRITVTTPGGIATSAGEVQTDN